MSATACQLPATKPDAPAREVRAGIDVSAGKLQLCLLSQAGDCAEHLLNNDPAGWRQLRKLLGSRGASVVLEATHNFSLDLALFLCADPQLELCLLNPSLAREFARSLGRRGKTDRVDARVLAEYARRMPLTAWQAPPPGAFSCAH